MANGVDLVLEQWSRARPDLDPWPIGVVGRLMRLSRFWDAEIKRFLAEHELLPGEFSVLSALRRIGEPYELSAHELVETSLVTSGAITNRIDRMEAKGLVVRDRGADDRRVVRIRLTDKGLALIDEVYPDHLAHEAKLLDGLSKRDLDRLAGSLSGLLERFEQADEG